MVGTPGLEPGRPIKPTDFKSVVFTNFTMPPCVFCQTDKLRLRFISDEVRLVKSFVLASVAVMPKQQIKPP